MKVLFVGDGPHDAAVIPELARRLCPAIVEHETLFWRDVPRFNLKSGHRGYAGKIAAALVLSERRGYAGTVCVVDRDGDPDRAAAVEDGRTRGLLLVAASHRAACGVAVESIEAWTLGDAEAVAAELEIAVERVRQHYPRGVQIEQLKESSGKEEHRPKRLLARVCELGRRAPDADFRQSVAARTDPERLRCACPDGFAPFAAALVTAFGPVEPGA